MTIKELKRKPFTKEKLLEKLIAHQGKNCTITPHQVELLTNWLKEDLNARHG